MTDVNSSTSMELLRYFHDSLAAHFGDLRDARATLEPSSPVFALEHDLSHDDLELLKEAVREAIKSHFITQYDLTWLPFVVYAAEMGYGYAGDEYWTTFSSLTPRWASQERSTVRDWFVRFHTQFGGAHPTGAWANHFTIISWPITHAVLPTYLQRQLAHLLYEFSGALTSELLDDPESLGIRLARRASNYTERFRIFCENTTLVGQVAAALLSGENESTPYLTASTLARIVDSLSEESQARHWLKSARASASRVRGFRPDGRHDAMNTSTSVHRVTDPRLFLRFDNGWNAFAELPDLTSLAADLPNIRSQLRTSRTTVNGGSRPIPPSGLLYPGQEVLLSRWPHPDQAFLQLDQGDADVNALLRAQCIITKGPWWLFRVQGPGLAVEVKGKFVRPGHRYVLIGTEALGAPGVSWCTETAIGADGVKAFDVQMPAQLSEGEEAALVGVGLSVVSHVSIRPVGIVASAWDGEGGVEWLAGEPAMIGIHSDLLPTRVRVVIAGSVYFLDWPEGESELLCSLEGIEVGAHELSVTLLGEGDRQLASGVLVVSIHDPRVRPEGATVGEGIRLLTTPHRPTMAELWDGKASVTIDGPHGTQADLRISLLDERAVSLTEMRRSVKLPILEEDWREIAKTFRKDKHFTDFYDSAESSVVSVVLAGVGFATVTCERGFQPLRWRFTRNYEGQVTATLVDRTDGGNTNSYFYDVEAPLKALPTDSASTLTVPPRGGLAVAKAGTAVASTILPANPNVMLRLPIARPVVKVASLSPREVLRLAEGHQRWLQAELPADVFATYQHQLVMDAIARAIGSLIGGDHWASLERKLTRVQDASEYLDDMRGAVGTSAEHKVLASAVAYSLYRWLKPEDLLTGFHDIISPHLTRYGLEGRATAPRFLLMLAARPGSISEWGSDETKFILDRVLRAPVLFRAARFAVLGTRALNDAENVGRGF